MPATLTKVYLQNSSGADKLTFPRVLISYGANTTPQLVTILDAGTTFIERAPGRGYDIFVDAFAAPRPSSPDIKLSFQIADDGTVTVDESSRDFLSVSSTADKTILTLRGLPITVNLADPQMLPRSLKKVGMLAAQAQQSIVLLPGRYGLGTSSSDSSLIFLEFALKLDGTLHHAPELEGVLHVSGSVLEINGVQVELDAQALTPPHLLQLFLRDQNYRILLFGSAEKQRLALLPAQYELTTLPVQVNTYVKDAHCGFEIKPQGPSLSADEKMLQVSGQQIKILGSAITVNAQDLSYQKIQIDQLKKSESSPGHIFHTASLEAVTLLPGIYGISSIFAADTQGFGYIEFRIDRQGKLVYLPESKELEGYGSTTLTVRGCRVIVDASALANPTLRIRGVPVSKDPLAPQSDLFPTRAPIKLRLFGNTKRLCYIDIDSGAFGFWIDEATGTVKLILSSSCWPGLVEVQDGSTIVIRGAEIELDLTRLAPFADDFALRTQASVPTLLGTFPCAQRHSIRLAPLSYVLHIAKRQLGSNAGSASLIPILTLPLQVATNGAISGLPAGPALVVESIPAAARNRIQVGISKRGPNEDWPIADSDKLPPGTYTASLVVKRDDVTSERVVKRVVVRA